MASKGKGVSGGDRVDRIRVILTSRNVKSLEKGASPHQTILPAAGLETVWCFCSPMTVCCVVYVLAPSSCSVPRFEERCFGQEPERLWPSASAHQDSAHHHAQEPMR